LPEAEVFEQRRALGGDGVDWRSTPFQASSAATSRWATGADRRATGDKPLAAVVERRPGRCRPYLDRFQTFRLALPAFFIELPVPLGSRQA
jgi:hypothetical protein